MKQKHFLSTEEIRSMGLKEFMTHRKEQGSAFACAELMQADSKWLLISDLEEIKSLSELRKLVSQMKEDLWWDIYRTEEAERNDC